MIARLVSEIDYDNFKNSLGTNDERYSESCIEVYNSVVRNSEVDTLTIEIGDFSEFHLWQAGI